MYPGRIIEEVMRMDASQIEYIMDAAIKRKRELYPDWEIFYCAAEKGRINGVEDMQRAAWESLNGGCGRKWRNRQ